LELSDALRGRELIFEISRDAVTMGPLRISYTVQDRARNTFCSEILTIDGATPAR
jgi:hypothetical protein